MSAASFISYQLATRARSPFFARRHLAVVPNVSWGFLPWEADLLVLSKSGYLNEIEIKVSMSDWRADAIKAKWNSPKFNQYIRKFWYAVPASLAERLTEISRPDFAGVVSVDKTGTSVKIKVIKYAKTRPATALDEAERLQIMRLGCLKAWRLAHTPTVQSMSWEAGIGPDPQA